MATEKALGKTNDNEKKKGVRKVNLSELSGSLTKRGRSPFNDAILKSALEELLKGNGNENAFIWIDGFVDPNTDEKEQVKLKAKFRQRATSMANQIAKTKGTEFPLTIQYTNDGEMLVIKRGVNA